MISDLLEETRYTKGTRVVSKRWGVCRVKFIYRDKVSVVFDRNPHGATSDYWMKIDQHGSLVDWPTD